MAIDYPYLLSIIIPSYERESLLHELILKIERQIKTIDNTKIEIIVVDDGSKRPLKQPNQSLAVSVKWIRLEKNMGAPHARKIGFWNSSGRFIHFHDSDDSIPAHWLKKLTRSLKKNGQIDILVTARKTVGIKTQKFKIQKVLNYFKCCPIKTRQRLNYENCLGPLGGITFSKETVQKMHFHNLPSCQDWDMYLDAIDQHTNITCDWSNYFIKNDELPDQISKDSKKKLLGLLRLARIHKIIVTKNSKMRSFYVFKIYRNKFLRNKRIERIFKRWFVAIILNYIFIINQRNKI